MTIFVYVHTYIVDCKWAAWNEWTPCSVTCGFGTQSQKRSQEQQLAHGGKPCEGQPMETKSCGKKQCPGKLSLALTILYQISMTIFLRIFMRYY